MWTRHSQDLAAFEMLECDLAANVPQAAAAHLPHNLQDLQLRHVPGVWYIEARGA